MLGFFMSGHVRRVEEHVWGRNELYELICWIIGKEIPHADRQRE